MPALRTPSFAPAAAAIAALALAAAPALAQSGEGDPVAAAPVHLGPVGLQPSIALTNLGVDTNVFNSAEDPQDDFTLTLEPRTGAWMHLGRGLLSAGASVGMVYFKRFASQRGIDAAGQLRLDVPLNRLRPYVSGQYVNAHQRTGHEIDARPRRMTSTTTAGVDVTLFGRTTVGAYARQERTRYDRGAEFLGVGLARSLDRTGEAAGVRVAEALTPFTTVILDAEVQRDRFRLLPERDADSARGSVGVQLDPNALISGSAEVGWRRFAPRAAGVPVYAGLTAAAEVGYVLLERTSFALAVDRDVHYSFNPDTPYYLLTGASGSARQEIAGPFQAIVQGGRQRLAYRGPAGVAAANRTDRVRFYGGGVGYRAGPTLQLDFTVNEYRRRSPLNAREYRGLRYGLSVVYGPQ